MDMNINYVQMDTVTELYRGVLKQVWGKYKYLALNVNVSIFMQQSSDNLHMASSNCCD